MKKLVMFIILFVLVVAIPASAINADSPLWKIDLVGEKITRFFVRDKISYDLEKLDERLAEIKELLAKNKTEEAQANYKVYTIQSKKAFSYAQKKNIDLTDEILVKAKSLEENKILICHKGIELIISENALQSHLAHGDYIGKCKTKPEPKPVVCVDGTPMGQCSTNKPYRCMDFGTPQLVENCKVCNCLEGYICDESTNKCVVSVPTPKPLPTPIEPLPIEPTPRPIEKPIPLPEPKPVVCVDGTPMGQCSTNKPYRCMDFGTPQLVENCKVCNCLEGYICDESTNKCVVSVPTPKPLPTPIEPLPIEPTPRPIPPLPVPQPPESPCTTCGVVDNDKIIKLSNRLLQLQNEDGGFPASTSGGVSDPEITSVVGKGIVDSYSATTRSESDWNRLLISALKAGNYVIQKQELNADDSIFLFKLWKFACSRSGNSCPYQEYKTKSTEYIKNKITKTNAVDFANNLVKKGNDGIIELAWWVIATQQNGNYNYVYLANVLSTTNPSSPKALAAKIYALQATNSNAYGSIVKKDVATLMSLNRCNTDLMTQVYIAEAMNMVGYGPLRFDATIKPYVFVSGCGYTDDAAANYILSKQTGTGEVSTSNYENGKALAAVVSAAYTEIYQILG